MRIVRIPRSDSNSLVVQLEHANMVFDPRYMGCGAQALGHIFSFSVKGRILTITRIADADENEGWPVFRLRAYLPTENIPDFTSTVYLYWGLDGEIAPKDTTKIIFHPSVTTIQEWAFYNCKSLVRVTIPDHVTEIGICAFFCCDSLRFIQLPTNLEFIGMSAFNTCKSLEAVFLPPTVIYIGNEAFKDCTSLRFCYLPETIDLLGIEVFGGCDRLLTTVNYEFYHDEDYDPINNDDVNEWFMQRYASLPFHQACFSTSITPQVIVHGIERATEVDHQQMTALHILCANPHVTGDCIRAYLQLAPEAANQEDSEGMTPFQYLCRNGIIIVEDGNFSSVMAWWYHCMP